VLVDSSAALEARGPRGLRLPSRVEGERGSAGTAGLLDLADDADDAPAAVDGHRGLHGEGEEDVALGDERGHLQPKRQPPAPQLQTQGGIQPEARGRGNLLRPAHYRYLFPEEGG